MNSSALNEVVNLTLGDVANITRRSLLACGVDSRNVQSVTASIVAAELEGIRSHGLARLPTYCEHVRLGKVDGRVLPELARPKAGLIRVDAKGGFAHPAIDLGLPALCEAAGMQGIAALAVANSYNCGVVGYHVRRIAEKGFLALAFVNTPAAIAPAGGSVPTFGTNPIAFSVPRSGKEPLVLDQSSSVVARGEVVARQQRGLPIPLGWALDRDGEPTTDPSAALDGGTMLPAGGVKGAGLALMVEIFAAWLTGSNFSIDASSFIGNDGGQPRTGQFFVAIDVSALAGEDSSRRLERLLGAITAQKGARLPGERRARARQRIAETGVTVPRALFESIQAYANGA